MYLDLHAHASARGCFIYGNHLPSLEDQVGYFVIFALLRIQNSSQLFSSELG